MIYICPQPSISGLTVFIDSISDAKDVKYLIKEALFLAQLASSPQDLVLLLFHCVTPQGELFFVSSA
jgi:hypothetical protein